MAVQTIIPLSELSPELRSAVRTMRKQFHRVELVLHDASRNECRVKVWRDEESKNPNRYLVYDNDGEMFRRYMDEDWRPHISSGFPVDPPPTPATEPRKPSPRPRRQKRAPAEVRHSNLPENITQLFIRRAEVMDELRATELIFTKEPNSLDALIMETTRAILTKIEQKIVEKTEQ